MEMDQPLDFSVKSPGSPGGYSSCSHNSKYNRQNDSNGTKKEKDDNYWARRQKNNAAAKRSRDARRQKEEQTKHENFILRKENEELKYSLRNFQEHMRVCPHARQ